MENKGVGCAHSQPLRNRDLVSACCVGGAPHHTACTGVGMASPQHVALLVLLAAPRNTPCHAVRPVRCACRQWLVPSLVPTFLGGDCVCHEQGGCICGVANDQHEVNLQVEGGAGYESS